MSTMTNKEKLNQGEHGFKFLTIFLVLCFNIVNGQKIDSLKTLLNGKTGLERYNILYQLAYEYVDLDYETALRYAEIAFQEAKLNGDSLNIVESGRILSLAYRRLGEIDSSIIISIEILPIAKRNTYVKELKSILNGLALGYTLKASYDKALKYYFQSMDLSLDEEDVYSNWYVLNNVGLVYYKMKDYNKALSYYNQALRVLEDVDNKDNLSILLANISLCHSHLKNHLVARESINRAINTCGMSCPDFVSLHIKYCLGVIYYELNDLLRAEPEFLESYTIAKKQKNKRLQLDNIVYLSDIYIKLNKLTLAERYVGETESLIGSGIPYNLELIKIYKELFKLHDKSGNYRRASQYLLRYTHLKDSIYNEELTTNLMKVEAEFLERENRDRIEVQDKILALNNEVIFKQKIVNISIGVVVVLLATFSFVLIRSNRHKKIMNRLLELKVKERTVELEQNQSILVKSLDERMLQFHKLSTDVKTSLATIRGLCTLALRDSDTPPPNQYLSRIEETVDQLLNTFSGVR